MFFFYRDAVNYFNMDSNGGASPGPQDHDMNESLGDLNEFLMRDAHVMTSLIVVYMNSEKVTGLDT